MESRYARITAPTGNPDLPLGSVVPIEFYHRGWSLPPGFEGAVFEVTVTTPAGSQATIPVRQFVYATAVEAKAWRSEQKKRRSQERRGQK
jgi:hypothetical protein